LVVLGDPHVVDHLVGYLAAQLVELTLHLRRVGEGGLLVDGEAVVHQLLAVLGINAVALHLHRQRHAPPTAA